MNILTVRLLTILGAIAIFAAGAAAQTTRPAAPVKPAPAARPAALKPGEKPPVQQAVAALLQEYQKAMADVKKAGGIKIPPPDPRKPGEAPAAALEPGLREHSDYFKKEADKAAGVTPDAIIAALEKQLSGDVRADAYVKWQLLSGVPDKFPRELLPRVYRIYRAAPRPSSNPGLNRNELDRALYRVGIRNQDAEAEVNAEYGNVITRYRIAIEPILCYRDELYSHLPAGFDTFMAGLEDIYGRVTVGAPANEFWTTLGAQVRSWGLDCKDAGQLRHLADVIMKVREVVRDDRNKPYGKVTWAKTDKFEGLKWSPEQAIQQDKSLEDTATWLHQQAENPGGGGLGFKEIKEKK